VDQSASERVFARCPCRKSLVHPPERIEDRKSHSASIGLARATGMAVSSLRQGPGMAMGKALPRPVKQVTIDRQIGG